jgi:glutamine amidotransferase-like uncharacterized protein
MFKPVIALFNHHPECSNQCCEAMMKALSSYYNFRIFSEHDIAPDMFDGVDIVAFPGGIGDADSHYKFFTRRFANQLAKYIDEGGRYLGICMGAYWTDQWYFDLIGDVRAVQYIKRPTSEIKRSHSTTARVNWQGTEQDMFFYDGCALLNLDSDTKVVATYSNGDAMAIFRGRVGIIGCHPEAEESWYDKKHLKKYLNKYEHHNLLLKFVDELMQQ